MVAAAAVARQRQAVGTRGAAGVQAPWHRLNFLPVPHQQGSLRPTSLCSLTAVAVRGAAAAPAGDTRVATRAAAAARRPRSRRRRRPSRAAYWRFPFAPASRLELLRLVRLDLGVEERQHDLLADRVAGAPRTSRGPRRGTRRAGPSAPSRAGGCRRGGSPSSRGARASACRRPGGSRSARSRASARRRSCCSFSLVRRRARPRRTPRSAPRASSSTSSRSSSTVMSVP